MQSHGSPACFAMSVISEMLPFDSGAMMNFFFSRVSPATASGHGRRRCQRAIERVVLGLGQPGDAELDEQLVEDHAMQAIELGPRQLAGPHAVHARRVARAPRVGEFRAVDRQALPPGERLDFPATDERQSTTVPNVSKTSALTEAVARLG